MFLNPTEISADLAPNFESTLSQKMPESRCSSPISASFVT